MVLFWYIIVWLAKPDSKMPCILLFEIEYLLEFISTNPPFLSCPFNTKICKRTSLDVYFSICKSQDRAINRQWIIQPKLIDCPSDTFFNFVIPQQICLIPLKVFKNWTRMNKNVDWVQKRSPNSLKHLRCRSLQQ